MLGMPKMDLAMPSVTIPVATPTAVVPLPPFAYVPSITVEYSSPQTQGRTCPLLTIHPYTLALALGTEKETHDTKNLNNILSP